jgi:hypothetical protein
MDAAEGAAGVPKALAKWMRQRLGTQFSPALTKALLLRRYSHLWVNKLSPKLFLDSEYYNYDYIGLKDNTLK